MQTKQSFIPISQEQLDEIKKSREHAGKLFKLFQIKGWPRVVTPEPNKHFLAES
jgi:hypothetical protein